jgi:outer membrane immunogenic protein
VKRVILGMAVFAALSAGSSALAADIPIRPAPPPPPFFSWTGFYIGVHVGAGLGTKEQEQFVSLGPIERLDSFSSHTVNGILGGGQIGYNYQAGWTVWGVEIQASAANLRGKGSCGFAAFFNCSTNVTGLATFAGRFGLTSDRILVYVKGGGAWAHDKYDLSFIGTNSEEIVPSFILDFRLGWMFGTGIEYAVAPNWSAKVEYNYMDFGTKSYLFNSTVGGGAAFPNVSSGAFDHFDITQRIHVIKFGINYRFDLGGYCCVKYEGRY